MFASIVGLLILSTIYYLKSQEVLKASIQNHLVATATSRKTQIYELVDRNRERVSLIASRTQLRISLSEYLRTGDLDHLTKMTRILTDARESILDFDEIHVVSLNGIVLASTVSSAVGGDRSSDTFVASGQRTITAGTIEVLRGRRTLFLSGPLFLNGELLGVVVVEGTPKKLDTIIYDYTGLGLTGEAMVVEQREGTIHALVPPRFERGATLHAVKVNPTELISIGDSLTVQTDYRGEKVFAKGESIADTDWMIVVKMDVAEALGPADGLRDYMLLAGILTALLAAIIAVIMSKMLTKPIIDLTEVARLIAGGNFENRIKKISKDELGQLAQALNFMADRLVDAKNLLERKVEEQTKELLQKNEDLILANQQLEIVSTRDGLTNLPNRRSFDIKLRDEWKRYERAGQPLSVVLLDIDHFKKFNDIVGHQAGDNCLRLVSTALEGTIQRAGDFVARYGGEEFVLVLPEADIVAAANVGDRVREAVEASGINHPGSDVSPNVTVSVGVATIVPTRDGAFEALVEAADMALYKAKEEGRNRVVVAKSLTELTSVNGSKVD